MRTEFPLREGYILGRDRFTRIFYPDGWRDIDLYGEVKQEELYPVLLGEVLGYFVDETRRTRIITMKFLYGQAMFYFSKKNDVSPKVDAICTREIADSSRLPGVVWVGQ